VKALTLTQPWASLVALDEKRIETRSWPAPATLRQGARFAIHAGKNLSPVGGRRGLEDLCASEPFRAALFERGPFRDPSELPLGAVVCSVELAGCIRTENCDFRSTATWVYPHFVGAEHERDFGDYTPGRHAWLLRGLLPVAEPIPARGHQGIWEWT
jgi:hypothetical protein